MVPHKAQASERRRNDRGERRTNGSGRPGPRRAVRLAARPGGSTPVESAADVLPPCGWACVAWGRDELAFQPERGDVELRGERVADRRWELRCVERAREATCRTLLGTAPTRESASSRLFDCMILLNEQGFADPVCVPALRSRLDWAAERGGAAGPRLQ